MQPGYLVDGYNVIHREPVLAALLGSDAEQARERLVSLLADFRAGRRLRMTVVFDGRGGTGLNAHTLAAGVRVYYARFPETADSRIIRLVRTARHPRSLTVVSSDRELVAYCRDAGAGSIGADEFLALMCRYIKQFSQGRPVPGDDNQDKPDMKPGDSADWAEYFRQGGMEVDREEGLW